MKTVPSCFQFTKPESNEDLPCDPTATKKTFSIKLSNPHFSFWINEIMYLYPADKMRPFTLFCTPDGVGAGQFAPGTFGS